MKYLGIDYGQKNIGIAVSNESGTIAFPYAILNNDKNTLNNLVSLINKENIEAIVVGESIDFLGNENPINESIKYFVENLKEHTELEVYFEKEWLTSMEARRVQVKEIKPNKRRGEKSINQNKKIDDSAAALILKAFLERKNNLL